MSKKPTFKTFTLVTIVALLAIIIVGIASSWDKETEKEQDPIISIEEDIKINITHVSFDVQDNMFSAEVDLDYRCENNTTNDFNIFIIVYDKIEGEWKETHFALHKVNMVPGNVTETLTDVIQIDNGYHLVRLDLWDHSDIPNTSTFEDSWEAPADINQGHLRTWQIIDSWP